MLSDSPPQPLNLDAALDAAYDSGDDAVIDLLESVLTDPRPGDAERVDEYLQPLVDAYRNTGRERDAIETLHRVGRLIPSQAGPMTIMAAGLHAELGEHLVASNLLRQCHAEEQARPAAERDIAFYATAVLTATEWIDDTDLALLLASDGLSLALERGEPMMILLFQSLRAWLAPEPRTPAERDLDIAPDRHPRGGSPAAQPVRPPQRPLYRVAYLPEAEYAAARARDLLDATLHPRHEDYRREIQDALETMAAKAGARVHVVPLDVAGLVAYAAREGLDPASRQTRLRYNDSLQGSGRDIAWPPERNASCWCGSGRKYKKCCGVPGFATVEVPDPASLVLRVELDDVTPAVWRRVAVPSNILLSHLHQVIQAVMGWHDEHLYEFDDGETSVTDPRSNRSGCRADEERLVSIANETGQQFTYTYDFGDQWAHTVTLEEIREAGPHNTPEIVDGAGACPPEDCGGPSGYLALLDALNHPAHPRHDEAIERLGEDFDPAQYDISRLRVPPELGVAGYSDG